MLQAASHQNSSRWCVPWELYPTKHYKSKCWAWKDGIYLRYDVQLYNVHDNFQAILISLGLFLQGCRLQATRVSAHTRLLRDFWRYVPHLILGYIYIYISVLQNYSTPWWRNRRGRRGNSAFTCKRTFLPCLCTQVSSHSQSWGHGRSVGSQAAVITSTTW